MAEKLLKNDQSKPLPDLLQAHPIMARHGQTMGMLSGESPRFPAEMTGHEAMGKQLAAMGLKAEPTDGMYGTPEKSYIVHNPTIEQMYSLGKSFGQDAVVFGQNGQHKMLYTNGEHDGRFHPSLPSMDYFDQPPSDYYTKLPSVGGYLRLHFNFDKLIDSPFRKQAGEIKKSQRWDTLQQLRLVKSLLIEAPQTHAHEYLWHDGHTSQHYATLGHGVLISPSGANVVPTLMKSLESPNFAQWAVPYGTQGELSNPEVYPYHNKLQDIERTVADHGYSTYFAGGSYGRPDLNKRNYNTNHLMIQGGALDDYTNGWRQMHELSHALTVGEVNKLYGEGKRKGQLGLHRSLNEGLRAVHWEWLAAHKQRELSKAIGVEIPDTDFHRELNQIMHGSVHQAITGKTTNTTFRPYSHKIPLETSLGMVREEGARLGLKSLDDKIKKQEELIKNLQEAEAQKIQPVKTLKFESVFPQVRKSDDPRAKMWGNPHERVQIPGSLHPERADYDQQAEKLIRSRYENEHHELVPVNVKVANVSPGNAIRNPHRHNMYSEMLRAGDKLSPMVVEPTTPGQTEFHPDAPMRTLDGSHRWHAYSDNKVQEAPAFMIRPRRVPKP